MSCRRGERGFTLIEMIVVMGILALLAGVTVETTTVAAEAAKRDRVQQELDDVAQALHWYYFDKGTFPAALTATGFYGVYVLPGVRDNLISDEWGARAIFRYQSISANPDVVVAYSLGEDGTDAGHANETYVAKVHGANAGNRQTREKLTQIGLAVATFVHGGGSLTGTWSNWQAALGLPSGLADDGFGTTFRVDADGRTVRSAGADRAFDTPDDLTW